MQWEVKIKDTAETQRTRRFRREKKTKSTAPDPRPTRKIGVWGTREKPRATQERQAEACATGSATFLRGLGVG
jgi:hypothetical protein